MSAKNKVFSVLLSLAGVMFASQTASAETIYVCNKGITDDDASTYTDNGKTYPMGNDEYTGSTPQTAVQTLKRAYELLSDKQHGGSTTKNTIVIMGDYSENCFTKYLDDQNTYTNPDYFLKDRAVRITGQYKNICNGRMLLDGQSIILMENTSFENLTFYPDNDDQDKAVSIYANGYDLSFGTGIFNESYSSFNVYGGCIDGDIPGSTSVTVLSGKFNNVFGGSRKGDINGETNITIGAADDSFGNNGLISIANIYGGNDITGTIGAGKADRGTHITIYGGNIGNVFGAGNGLRTDAANKLDDRKAASLARPHISATWIAVSGSEGSPTVIKGSIYGGGNNTTVGVFAKSKNSKAKYGMLREDLLPNSGSIRINIGSHVRIDNLVMGSNGEHLLDYIPSYTADGKTWHKGFENQADFEMFCHSVDVSCVPVLTFNADRQFHNNHPIDDRMNRQVYFKTPGEMDSEDVVIGTFVGGGNCGSMTGDSLYQYTLPTGVLIEHRIIGGSKSSIIEYTETEGPEAGVTRRYVGGMKPYRNVEVALHEQRTQLNIFCQFAPMHREGNSYDGPKIYGGCFNKGVVVGVSVVNLHSDLLGGFKPQDCTLHDIANAWDNDGGQIYGGGKGIETEAIGNTYVNLKGGVFNGKKCIPNILHAFGGGMAGNVIGRSNVYCDFQSPMATPMDAIEYCVWGNIYGGGRQGSIVRHSKLLPNVEEPHENGTHVRVWSGQIAQVFGGSRIGNVEGASFVDIDDRGENHFHTIINSVYGGNDLSGRIGCNTIPAMIEGNEPVTTNTYVLIREQKKANGQYLGFPVIAQVFGGGNGNYGVHSASKLSYESGSIPTRNGQRIDLTGLPYPNVDSTYVEVRGGSIWYLYGGANASYVTKATTIRIDYNDENAGVRACFDGTSSAECYQRGKYVNDTFGNYDGAIVTENKITARSNVLTVFGGNKQSPLIIQPDWQLGQANIHYLFGGCNLGNVYYYNDDQSAGVANLGLHLTLNHPKLSIDNVFGGCRLGSVIACNNRIDADGSFSHTPLTLKDNEFGTAIHVIDGTYGRIFGGNDISGTVLGGSRMHVEGGIVGELYGAGNGEHYYQYTDKVTEPEAHFNQTLMHYLCLVPASKQYGGKNATPFQILKAIEAVRPNIAKSYIEISGGIDQQTGKRRTAYITGGIYAGGNCATIVDPSGKPGDIRLDIGDYCVINNVYMGSNGVKHIEKDYIKQLLQYNDIDISQLSDTENGRTLLDYHMDAVTMHGLPRDFRLHKSYENCYIGSFFMGGARGSIAAHGKLAVTFPKSLVIFGKIVGGSDRGLVSIMNGNTSAIHEGGILWDGIDQKPQIDLTVECEFINSEMIIDPKYASNNYLREGSYFDAGPKVYGGCYMSGKVEGEVNVELLTEDF